MQKNFLLATVVLFTASTILAQDKKVTDPPPPPPPKIEKKKIPPPPKVDIEKFSAPTPEYKNFLERNPTVKKLGWGMDNSVRVYLKDGKEEKYKLNDKEEAERLEDKYGKLPPAPPSPPEVKPKNPAPSKKSAEPVKFTPPQIKKDQELQPPPIEVVECNLTPPRELPSINKEKLSPPVPIKVK